tara:strand:+ start:485 stop:694 length:210 start_codon:yes stop_codon:yes gene_type:complete
MQFEKGDTTEDIINNVYALFYFNLMTGDFSMDYCKRELKRQEDLEEYEICEGIQKAIRFKKYGDSNTEY